LETLAQDYILTARAKGLPEQTVFLKHAFRNAINPLITMLGNSTGSLLSGAFIVEAIMSWPGLGDLTVSSLLSRDLYVLVACLIFAAALLALGNLLADVLLALTDPRIRQTRQF
jgi:peptide/nickel transport system permease protein